MKSRIYFTDRNGSTATIKGDLEAVEAIERAFRAAGIKYNRQTAEWDEGFYKKDDACHGPEDTVCQICGMERNE